MMRRTPLLAALLAAFCSVAPGGTKSDSLYARLGGEVGVAAIVNDTVDAAASIPALHAAFDSSDMKQLLAAQICALSGGGCRAQHAPDLGAREFIEFVELLRVTLRTHAVPLAARNELLESLAPMRRDLASR